MKRRSLVELLATAIVLSSPVLAWAQPTITLKFHTFMAPQSNVWLTMHKPWMAKIEKESGGRIQFEAYPAMQLGGTPAQLYDQVKDGVVDVIWTLPGYTAGRFPRLEVFDLPFMMSNAEATSRAAWDYVQAHAADEFKDVHMLALNVHGPGVIHTAGKAVKTVADMKGLKMRGPTRQVTKLLSALGAIPVGMPLPSIPDALSKGTLQGAVIPWEVVPSVKVQELTAFHTEFDPAGGALYTTSFVLAMNKAKYNSLPPDLKQVIDRNSGRETSAWLGKVQQANDVQGRNAALERKNTLLTIGPEEAQNFRRQSRQIEVEWVQDMNKRGHNGTQLLAAARALIDQHSRAKLKPAPAKPVSAKPAPAQAGSKP